MLKNRPFFPAYQRGISLIQMVIVLAISTSMVVGLAESGKAAQRWATANRTEAGFVHVSEALYNHYSDEGKAWYGTWPADIATLEARGYLPVFTNVNGAGLPYSITPVGDDVTISTQLKTLEQARGVANRFGTNSALDAGTLTVSVSMVEPGNESAHDQLLPRDGSRSMQGTLVFDAGTGGIDLNGNSIADVGDVTANRLVDRNNGAYSVDPASRSEFNTFDFRSARDQDNTAYTLDPSGRSELNTADFRSMRDQDNTAYTIDPSGRSEFNTFDFRSARDQDNPSYTVNPSWRSEFYTLDVRSIRDQDNTSFTVDPSGTSRMNFVNANRVRTQSSYTAGSSCTSHGVGTYARSGSQPIFCDGSTWQVVGGLNPSITFYNPTKSVINMGKKDFCALSATTGTTGDSCRVTRGEDGNWYAYEATSSPYCAVVCMVSK